MVFHWRKTRNYLTVGTTLHTNHPSAQRSPLLQFALSRGPRNLVYRIVVNITFLLAILDEGTGNTGNTFLWLADTRHCDNLSLS